MSLQPISVLLMSVRPVTARFANSRFASPLSTYTRPDCACSVYPRYTQIASLSFLIFSSFLQLLLLLLLHLLEAVVDDSDYKQQVEKLNMHAVYLMLILVTHAVHKGVKYPV